MRTRSGPQPGRSREDDRFDELYVRCYRPVRDYCRRRVAADVVDDAVAEVFLTAWRRLDTVPDGDAALAWLYAVAYRVVGHQWRSTNRQNRLKVRIGAVSERPESTADEWVVDPDESRLVLEAVACLGDTDAEVLLLQAWEHLAVVEIAAVVGISPNAVSQRIHRARRNLGREYRRLQSEQVPTPRATEEGEQ